MNDEALSPHERVLCGRCSSFCDPEDNFCRDCGLALSSEVRLPAVRNGALPAVWRPRVPVVVVKSAAFVVAGTLAEVLVRRLVRNVLGRARHGTPEHPIANANGHVLDETDMVSETYLLRRVRLRR